MSEKLFKIGLINYKKGLLREVEKTEQPQGLNKREAYEYLTSLGITPSAYLVFLYVNQLTHEPPV